MDDLNADASHVSEENQLEAFEKSFLSVHGPLPPPDSCPISWQPSALTPVFYGVRDYGSATGAPLNLRVFFPSLDGAVYSAPILQGCGRYPLVLLAHGDCHPSVEHYKNWFLLPAQLARAGYIVVVPELPNIATHPSAEDHPALPAIARTLAWMRTGWEHKNVLMPARATGIIGHSFGALLAARFAGTNVMAAFASLSGVWQDWPSGPLPIARLTIPIFFTWGEEDQFVALSEQQWNALALPKHRVVFANGLHWDYLPQGSTPCDQARGPCRYLALAVADYVTMFFAKYLPPELSPHLLDRIPDSLTPPPLVLTPEQEFYAGSYLIGVKALQGRTECANSLTWVTEETRIVPFVRFLPQSAADRQVRSRGLVPRYTGSGGRGAWVFNQSPQPGRIVEVGATVTMQLRTGPIP